MHHYNHHDHALPFGSSRIRSSSSTPARKRTTPSSVTIIPTTQSFSTPLLPTPTPFPYTGRHENKTGIIIVAGIFVRGILAYTGFVVWRKFIPHHHPGDDIFDTEYEGKTPSTNVQHDFVCLRRFDYWAPADIEGWEQG